MHSGSSEAKTVEYKHASSAQVRHILYAGRFYDYQRIESPKVNKKCGSAALGQSGELHSRFLLFRSVEKRTIFPAQSRLQGRIGNHKGLVVKSRYRGRNSRFSTLIHTAFSAFGEVTGTDNHFCLRTLLTRMGAGPAERIILTSAVTAQEERPFQMPLLASAHRSPCSGTSRPGRFPSGCFCWAISFFAASSRSRMDVLPKGSSRRPLLITPSIIP